jgi:hypothetical protein
VNEVALLPEAVRAVMETVAVPLCIDSDNPAALAAALEIYEGKPIINSINGQEQRLQRVLPLAKEHGAAVVGLTMDDQGIPKDADQRVAIAGKIIGRASEVGIPPEDVIIDALALTVGADTEAARVTLEAVQRIRDAFGVNQTLGASNVSFGLPDRDLINGSFLARAIAGIGRQPAHLRLVGCDGRVANHPGEGTSCPEVSTALGCRGVGGAVERPAGHGAHGRPKGTGSAMVCVRRNRQTPSG